MLEGVKTPDSIYRWRYGTRTTSYHYLFLGLATGARVRIVAVDLTVKRDLSFRPITAVYSGYRAP
jgi:hypothetical protein